MTLVGLRSLHKAARRPTAPLGPRYEQTATKVIAAMFSAAMDAVTVAGTEQAMGGYPDALEGAVHRALHAHQADLAAVLVRAAGDVAAAELPPLMAGTPLQKADEVLSIPDGELLARLKLDAVDQYAVQWAQAHTGELITQIDDGTSALIRSMVVENLKGGSWNGKVLTPQSLAKEIASHVGLPAPWAKAPGNAANQALHAAVKAGKTLDEAEALAMKASEATTARLVKARAKMIARTELLTAQNQGRMGAWKAAANNGLLNLQTAKKRWIVGPDGWAGIGVCPKCSALGGQEIPVEEDWPFGGNMPPRHPHCRCTCILIPAGFAAGPSPKEVVPALMPPLPAPAQLFGPAGLIEKRGKDAMEKLGPWLGAKADVLHALDWEYKALQDFTDPGLTFRDLLQGQLAQGHAAPIVGDIAKALDTIGGPPIKLDLWWSPDQFSTIRKAIDDGTNDMVIGTTVKEATFSTAKVVPADAWATAADQDYDIIFHVQVPKGGVDGVTSGFYDGGYGPEYLFAPDTEYLITGIREIDYPPHGTRQVIDLEPVPKAVIPDPVPVPSSHTVTGWIEDPDTGAMKWHDGTGNAYTEAEYWNLPQNSIDWDATPTAGPSDLKAPVWNWSDSEIAAWNAQHPNLPTPLVNQGMAELENLGIVDFDGILQPDVVAMLEHAATAVAPAAVDLVALGQQTTQTLTAHLAGNKTKNAAGKTLKTVPGKPAANKAAGGYWLSTNDTAKLPAIQEIIGPLPVDAKGYFITNGYQVDQILAAGEWKPYKGYKALSLDPTKPMGYAGADAVLIKVDIPAGHKSFYWDGDVTGKTGSNDPKKGLVLDAKDSSKHWVVTGTEEVDFRDGKGPRKMITVALQDAPPVNTNIDAPWKAQTGAQAAPSAPNPPTPPPSPPPPPVAPVAPPTPPPPSVPITPATPTVTIPVVTAPLPGVPGGGGWTAPTFDTSTLRVAPTQPTLGGAHAKTVYVDAAGDQYLFKPMQGWVADGEVAAAAIARLSGIDIPEVYQVTIGGQTGSLQKMVPSARPAWPGGKAAFDPTMLTKADLDVIQQHRALDWLIGNHDSHADQWIREGYAASGAKPVGIDKGQAFKYWGSDKLDYKYHPNSAYGEAKPVYNLVEEAYATGTLPDGMLTTITNTTGSANIVGETIERLAAIPDATYREMLAPYARGRFITDAAIERFLDEAVARKNGLRKNFAGYHEKLRAARRKAKGPRQTVVQRPIGGGTGGPRGMTGAVQSEKDLAWLRQHDSPLTDAATSKGVATWTGSSYSTINDPIRRAGRRANLTGTAAKVRRELGTIKTDMIVHRGTSLDHVMERTMNPADLTGRVLTDWGFTASSVGGRPAFEHKPVIMKIRLNAGTRASHIDYVSRVGGENEMLLDAGQHYYVHSAVQRDGPQGYRWYLEMETVDPAWAENNADIWNPATKRWERAGTPESQR